MAGVHDDEREIPDAQCAQAFTDEIRVAGAVEHVELLAEPLEVHQRRGDGNLPLLFADVIVGHGRAGGDAAHAIDHAGAREHGFAQHGFAGGGVADEGEVADVSRLEFFHGKNLSRFEPDRVSWKTSCSWRECK